MVRAFAPFYLYEPKSSLEEGQLGWGIPGLFHMHPFHKIPILSALDAKNLGFPFALPQRVPCPDIMAISLENDTFAGGMGAAGDYRHLGFRTYPTV